MTNSPSYRFLENIEPSRFVKPDTSDDFSVRKAGLTDFAIGVSHEGSRDAPIPEITTHYAAKTGESARVYGEDETCEVLAGAAIVKADKYVRPDANGKAIPARHGLPYCGQIEASAAAADEMLRIVVKTGVFDNSASVYTKTADATVLEKECGGTFTNTGAAGTVTLSLPAATVGMEYNFSVDAAQELRIDPDGTETIALPSTGVQGAAGKYLTANAANETLTLRCNRAGEWDVVTSVGTWTAEA